MSKEKILKSSLPELVARFSQLDVVEEMEKRYQNAPAKLISTESLDDNAFVKEIAIPAKTIETFAQTLSSRGFYAPVVVKEKGDRYEVILGRKRLYGAKKAGILSLPAVIVSITEEEELLVLLADNRDQRESHILEMACVCSILQRKYGYSVSTLAKLSHQSRSQIANTLRLLSLPRELKDDLNEGILSYGHARAILTLNEKDADELAKQIKEHHLSVRETEARAKAIRQSQGDESAFASWCEHQGITLRETKTGIHLAFESEEQKEEFKASLKKHD